MSLPLVILLAAALPQPSALEAQPHGWIDILPGPALEGWIRVAPISSRGIKTSVNREVQVWVPDRKSGVLECRAQLPRPGRTERSGSHEMLRHHLELGDFIFHVEWRFKDPRRTGWNAGVYARVRADAAVWHQAQVGGVASGFWSADTPDETGKIVRVDGCGERAAREAARASGTCTSSRDEATA